MLIEMYYFIHPDLAEGQHLRHDLLGNRHSFVARSRNALSITETELKLIAAAAKIGLSRRPKTG